MGLNHDDIAEIIRLVDGSSLDELIVDTGDVKLVVRRNGVTGRAELSDDRPRASAAPGSGSTVAAPAKAATKAGQVEVAAPMVGTFYRAPRPDAPPFVEVGALVKADQPLCIIEVMKLFTTIKSEVDGKVVQIAAENGELVEYGRTLFVIEPV